MDCKCSVRQIAFVMLIPWHSYVPGDQAGLISLYGGPTGFVKRLDYLHDQNITYIGNEVLGFLSPFLFEPS